MMQHRMLFRRSGNGRGGKAYRDAPWSELRAVQAREGDIAGAYSRIILQTNSPSNGPKATIEEMRGKPPLFHDVFINFTIDVHDFATKGNGEWRHVLRGAWGITLIWATLTITRFSRRADPHRSSADAQKIHMTLVSFPRTRSVKEIGALIDRTCAAHPFPHLC